MWEFRRGNVFASTAFSSYGAFWIGLFVWIRVAPVASGHDLGWILLAFAIFNTYMLLMATQVNLAVFGVFLFLELTEIFLAIGNFSSSPGLGQLGGYLGLVTALSPGTPRRRASRPAWAAGSSCPSASRSSPNGTNRHLSHRSVISPT